MFDVVDYRADPSFQKMNQLQEQQGENSETKTEQREKAGKNLYSKK